MADGLFWVEGRLGALFVWLGAPDWVRGLIVDGMYRTLAWVVSVMLPPMAIFFPLFTLLEDSGYLPRIAFNLDNFFRRACAHGKQALTMCMGFGCNAAGVVGCRIIDSPRERLIAILTNNFVPCNGRFPTLIAIITMFFAGGVLGAFGSLVSTLMLTGVIVLGVTATDPDATTVTYALGDDAPDGMTIDPSTGEIHWTPTEAQGTGIPITFTVTATDEFDSIGFTDLTVTVNGADGAPTLPDLSDVTLSAGAPMYIVLDGYDPEDALTYTVSCDNAQISTLIPDDAGNRSLSISVANYGEMVFQLFEELAPNTTGRIIELAQDGFYEDVLFHRVIDDFMIQAGDPTGTGSGGSGLGDIDDEFHELLMHTVPGMISMAKSSDDTGDSQFFITEIATRWLDFDYSVFGFQTDGEDVRDAISEVAVDTTDRPTTDVVIESIDVFTDTQRGVLVLSAPEGYTGTATVTVTVDDGNGGTAQRQFDVQVVEDTSEYANSNPWLGDMDPIETVSGEAGNSQIPAFDIEGDDIYYAGIVDPENEDIELLVDAATGEVNWQTAADVVGIHGLFLGVREFGETLWDTQAVPLFVAPGGAERRLARRPRTPAFPIPTTSRISTTPRQATSCGFASARSFPARRSISTPAINSSAGERPLPIR